MNNFEILGIPVGSSQEIIKVAFRKLAHIHHPDKGGNADDFKRISKAYHELQNGITGEVFINSGHSPFYDNPVYGFNGAHARRSSEIEEILRSFARAQADAQARKESIIAEARRKADFMNQFKTTPGAKWH